MFSGRFSLLRADLFCDGPKVGLIQRLAVEQIARRSLQQRPVRLKKRDRTREDVIDDCLDSYIHPLGRCLAVAAVEPSGLITRAKEAGPLVVIADMAQIGVHAVARDHARAMSVAFTRSSAAPVER